MQECAICQHQNRHGAFFCAQCGTKLHFMEMPGAVVVEINSGGESENHSVSSRVTYIGRSQSNQIVLANQGISKHHAKITFADGEYQIEDLDSVNGTFVNGKRSNGRSKIGSGDLIRLGSVLVKFQLVKQGA